MKLKIALISDENSWLNDDICKLSKLWRNSGHEVSWVHEPKSIPMGDLCFLVGCSSLLKPDVLKRNQNNLVVHESDLPKGKGWSPMTWQILEGTKSVMVTLFEAVTAVDGGPIYLQEEVSFEGHEILDEIRAIQSATTFRLCQKFLEDYPQIISKATSQQGRESFFPRRKPEDSRLDPDKTIADQFNLFRVVDNESYPAFFELNGYRYILKISKVNKELN